MATIASLRYSIDDQKKVNWSVAQENSLSSDFPFELNDETPEEFVYRTYLQFLWLPESIMPLHLLVPALRRLRTSSSSATHPLHGVLDEILLTVPTMTSKYRKELTHILVNGGGAGEIEEGMMWFALTHEKADTVEPWLQLSWREQWLDRLERREVQIQILLYFLKLSLPAPSSSSKPKGKPKRSSSSEITTEEYAEAFMDKLSMWQLLNAVKSTNGDKGDGRDWMQTFCEEIVEQEFQSLIPKQCELLRSKVFPHSPFSDNESNASTTRASSPASDSHSLRAKASDRAPSKSGSKQDARELARARSRSLSVSLAHERGQTVCSSANAASTAKRRLVTREISMSRVFKPKPKPTAPPPSEESGEAGSSSQTQPELQSQLKNQAVGVTLVEDTPVKHREPPRSRTLSLTKAKPCIFPISSSSFATSLSSGGGLFGGRDSTTSSSGSMAGTDNDDAWQISSSPDIMLLASPSKLGLQTEDEDEDISMDRYPLTPSKPSRRRLKNAVRQ